MKILGGGVARALVGGGGVVFCGCLLFGDDGVPGYPMVMVFWIVLR